MDLLKLRKKNSRWICLAADDFNSSMIRGQMATSVEQKGESWHRLGDVVKIVRFGVTWLI